MNLLKKIKSQKGATMVEYAIMLALIAVVSIGILTTLGGNVKNTFTSVNDKLTNNG